MADIPQKPTSLDDLLGNGFASAPKPSPNPTPTSPTGEGTGKTSGNSLSLDDLLAGKSTGGSPSASSASGGNVPLQRNSENSFTQAFQKQGIDAKDERTLLSDIESFDTGNENEGLALSVDHDEDPDDIEDPKITEAKASLRTAEEAFLSFKKLLLLSQSFLALFIFLGAGGFLFFSILLDSEGIFADLYEGNFGVHLVKLEEEKKLAQQDLSDAKRRIKETEAKIQNLENNDLVSQVVSERTDWFEAIERINDIDKSISYSDDTFVFENYSTQKGSNEISIQGIVQDPSGRVFQQISKLLESLNDSPYFSGAKLQNYTKEEDTDYGYKTTFNFKLMYYKYGKNAEEKPKEKGSPNTDTPPPTPSPSS